MPPNDPRTQWCDEAKRILTLARSQRAAPEKALAKSLSEQNRQLGEALGKLRGLTKADPPMVDAAALDKLVHDLKIAASQINIESYALAAEAQVAVADELATLQAAAKSQGKAAVEKASKASNDRRAALKKQLGDKLKEAGGAAPSAELLAELRALAEQEFARDADQAALLAGASALDLGLEPPPARTAFADNRTACAAVWTEAICRAAFQTHTWFDFKAFRKQGAAAQFKVPGLDPANCVISDEVMWRLYQFRRHVVDGLVAQLHAKYKGQLLFSSNGSEDIESDLDITVASPRSGVDVEAMAWFNAQIKGMFGRPPGRVFDTNLYARDYNAIKTDNLSKKGVTPASADHAIDEPGGEMQKMANIDQDVATLMKQRRFMDAEAFTAMWEGLQASMDEAQQDDIRQRFEEAESAYLLTAMTKVDAIERKVQEAVENFDGEKFSALYGDERTAEQLQRHEEFRRRMAQMSKARAAHAAARPGTNQTRALLDYQHMQDAFLDFMEQNFEDETMEATDKLYAERMAELRADQAFIHQQEQALAQAPADAPGRAQMEAALASAKARAKQAQFTNIVFANEAYVSQGAITHVVSGKQAGDASVLAAIPPAALVQSSNEQLADFLKDMKHMEHGAAEADGDTRRRQANGEAFVHASKYLARMLEAVAMLEDKYTHQLSGKGDEAEEQLRALKEPPYPLVRGAGAATPKALQGVVEGHLLKLRKSATVPGEVKAEMAVAESLKLFGAADIPALRTKIQAFCTEFNRRVRSMEDFQQSQAASETAFRQYFDPAYQPPAELAS